MIFIDTGAFLARFIERDQHHETANEYWKKLSHEKSPCFTSSYVLSETLTLLGRRSSHVFAAERARSLFSSAVLCVIRPNASDDEAAVILFEKFSDQKVSFCDCVSFVLMRRLGITNFALCSLAVYIGVVRKDFRDVPIRNEPSNPLVVENNAGRAVPRSSDCKRLLYMDDRSVVEMYFQRQERNSVHQFQHLRRVHGKTYRYARV